MGVSPRLLIPGLLLALAPLAAGCQGEPEDRDVVAFLVADAGGDRWRDQDLPAFGTALDEVCADCVPLIRDAGGDPATQRRQLADVQRAGADVVVLNAVSGETGEELVRASRVPVIAYDRQVPGADHLVDVDDEVGAVDLTRTLRGLLPRGRSEVLVVSDGPGGLTDRVVDRLGRRIRVRATLPPDRRAEARQWVGRQLAAGPVSAVLTGDDAVAGEVVTGLGEAGIPVPDRPLVTGHDATLEAVRRLIVGTQAVTVHASRSDEAAAAADVAARLAQGRRAPAPDLEVEGVPAVVVPPTVVTLPTLTNTLVREGVYTLNDLCPTELLARCEQLGLR